MTGLRSDPQRESPVLTDGARAVLALADPTAPPFETGTPQAARAAYDAGRPAVQGERAAVAAVRDLVIEDGIGALPARLYRGHGAPASGAPALLYLHGGGWVLGGLDSHDEVCRAFADMAGAVVLCPDYRLAPEHRFPAAVEDGRRALAWLRKRAGEFGVDPARIAVGGDSAGGNLATVTALAARGDDAPPLTAQLLFYPNTDAAQDSDSFRLFASGYGLTAATMRWFRDLTIRDAADLADWRFSPLKSADLTGAPPAYVAIAEADILADEGIAYARRLEAAGVPTVFERWPGLIHGFVSMGRHIPQSREAIAAAVAAWKRFEAR
ncbi:alpha/beta hydrolase [Aureimonas pseudogalii]|uniref:Acetyl esterase n=1 Tax=Aureimonas pseudogalii TaxID=1744844 RepID=A0A7W6H4R5_9HYPH|nr:alpha/beta hydrolase [Aureimonas pseudogalii]MBB3997879.1 acetyl esterase [Aureimonas pseudogalii]